MQAVFDGTGRILVASNTIPAGFYFDTHGNCLESVDLLTILPTAIAATDHGVAVLETTRTSYRVSIVDGKNNKSVVYEDDDFSRTNAAYRGLSHLVPVADGRVALSLIHGPLIKIITLSTGESVEIGAQPEYYRKVTRDVAASFIKSQDVMRDLRQIFEGKSRTSFVGAGYGFVFREGAGYDVGDENSNRPIVVYRVLQQ